LSQTIHETLDAYDTLKLRKASASASEAEQQGKDFVKDLGVNRKEMKKAAFSATRSIYGVVMVAALSVFGVVLIALTVHHGTTTASEYEKGWLRSFNKLPRPSFR
jgi:hypothetical protein